MNRIPEAIVVILNGHLRDLNVFRCQHRFAFDQGKPSLVEYHQYRFLITDCPKDDNLASYIREMKKNNVCHGDWRSIEAGQFQKSKMQNSQEWTALFFMASSAR